MTFRFKHGDRPVEGYTIQRGLGRGGFGEVYYAISDGGREVALKYLHSNQDIELRGIGHCMNMKSPHLVSIFDVVRNTAGDCFVIMEHVAGPSLRDLMVREGRGLGEEKATFFMREIARGLQYLHDRGIVHRDLKPGNIFFEEGYVKIGDYGLSKFIAQSAAGANTQSVGTVHYMAPEVGSGHYSKSIDIYALGVILYEMLLGKVPFEGQSAGEVLMKHLMDQPEVDAYPEPFPRVIRKALAKDPRDRYQDVKEMVEDVLGPGGFESPAPGDSDSLTPIAARVARNLRHEAPTLPAATAPEHRGFEGSSAIGMPDRPVELDYADQQRRGFTPPMQPAARFAGFWIRVRACAIDVLVTMLPVLIFLAIFPPLGHLAGLLYGVLLLTYWNGQTVGKFVCKIRVVDLYGRPITFPRALGREVSKYLSMLTFLVGFMLAGWTRRKQALHDLIASTCVIYVGSDAPVLLPYDAAVHRQQERLAGRVVGSGAKVPEKVQGG